MQGRGVSTVGNTDRIPRQRQPPHLWLHCKQMGCSLEAQVDTAVGVVQSCGIKIKLL